MRLVDVYTVGTRHGILYALLEERTPDESISHKRMPTWNEHVAFVESKPYAAWYLIDSGEAFVGAIYLTYSREVGIFIFRSEQGRRFATQAVNILRKKHPGPLLANVNPKNEASRRLWERLGGQIIQVTYGLE